MMVSKPIPLKKMTEEAQSKLPTAPKKPSEYDVKNDWTRFKKESQFLKTAVEQASFLFKDRMVQIKYVAISTLMALSEQARQRREAVELGSLMMDQRDALMDVVDELVDAENAGLFSKRGMRKAAINRLIKLTENIRRSDEEEEADVDEITGASHTVGGPTLEPVSVEGMGEDLPEADQHDSEKRESD